MDEKLRLTIDKIIRLCQQNAEFDKELRKRLGVASSANDFCHGDDRINHIEKYLGLDYNVDGQPSNVDYSFVKEPSVRDQLVSDNREMMRFRYGTRYHKIDFYEFCRYAHLQVEMMLNYYYEVANKSDIEAIRQHIWKYNREGKGVAKAESVRDIPFNTKLWAFGKQYNVCFNLFDNVRRVRNDLSHRSFSQNETTIAEYQNKLIKRGFRLGKNGALVLNWRDKEADKELKEVFAKLKYDQKYKDYLYMSWCCSMPYDDVIVGIRTIAGVIGKTLNS